MPCLFFHQYTKSSPFSQDVSLFSAKPVTVNYRSNVRTVLRIFKHSYLNKSTLKSFFLVEVSFFHNLALYLQFLLSKMSYKGCFQYSIDHLTCFIVVNTIFYPRGAHHLPEWPHQGSSIKLSFTVLSLSLCPAAHLSLVIYYDFTAFKKANLVH